jgi:uncharacterized protein
VGTCLKFVYESKLLEEKNFLIPGIYLISGGRQIGKTTFLKQLILKWLKEKTFLPENLYFITGELIDTHHVLRRIITTFHKAEQRQVLFIDEVNYIPDWDKTVKFIADAGMTENPTKLFPGLSSCYQRVSFDSGYPESGIYHLHPLDNRRLPEIQ